MQLRCFGSPTHWQPRHSHFDGFVPVFRFDAPRTATLLPRNNPPKQAQEIGFEIKQMAGQTERHWTSMRKSCMLHSSLPTFFYFNYPTLHVYILKGSAPLLWANGCLPKTWSSVLEHCIEEICPSEQIWLVGHVLIIFGRILHEKKLCKGNSKLHYIKSQSKIPQKPVFLSSYMWTSNRSSSATFHVRQMTSAEHRWQRFPYWPTLRCFEPGNISEPLSFLWKSSNSYQFWYTIIETTRW